MFLRLLVKRHTLKLVAILTGLATSGFSEELHIEIFIPGSDVEVNSTDAQYSNLARCLNTAKMEYCAGVQVEGDGSIYESYDQKQITLETLIITDDKNIHVQTQDQNIEPSKIVATTTDEQQPISDAENRMTSISVEILFDFDSYKIRRDQISKVNELSKALSEDLNAGLTFAIIGHTDAKGPDAYNCKLSKGRASSVATAMKIGGVRSDLYAIGVGEFLLKDADNPEDEKNRRVSILRLDKSAERLVETMSSLCS